MKSNPLHTYRCECKIVSPCTMETQARSRDEAERLFRSKQGKSLDHGPDEVFIMKIEEVEG